MTTQWVTAVQGLKVASCLGDSTCETDKIFGGLSDLKSLSCGHCWLKSSWRSEKVVQIGTPPCQWALACTLPKPFIMESIFLLLKGGTTVSLFPRAPPMCWSMPCVLGVCCVLYSVLLAKKHAECSS